jgi:hypothetical protein
VASHKLTEDREKRREIYRRCRDDFGVGYITASLVVAFLGSLTALLALLIATDAGRVVPFGVTLSALSATVILSLVVPTDAIVSVRPITWHYSRYVVTSCLWFATASIIETAFLFSATCIPNHAFLWTNCGNPTILLLDGVWVSLSVPRGVSVGSLIPASASAGVAQLQGICTDRDNTTADLSAFVYRSMPNFDSSQEDYYECSVKNFGISGAGHQPVPAQLILYVLVTVPILVSFFVIAIATIAESMPTDVLRFYLLRCSREKICVHRHRTVLRIVKVFAHVFCPMLVQFACMFGIAGIETAMIVFVLFVIAFMTLLRILEHFEWFFIPKESELIKRRLNSKEDDACRSHVDQQQNEESEQQREGTKQKHHHELQRRAKVDKIVRLVHCCANLVIISLVWSQQVPLVVVFSLVSVVLWLSSGFRVPFIVFYRAEGNKKDYVVFFFSILGSFASAAIILVQIRIPNRPALVLIPLTAHLISHWGSAVSQVANDKSWGSSALLTKVMLILLPFLSLLLIPVWLYLPTASSDDQGYLLATCLVALYSQYIASFPQEVPQDH